MNYCSTKDVNGLCEIELDGFLARTICNFALFFNFPIYTPWTAELRMGFLSLLDIFERKLPTVAIF
jgi:hypothetical protein